jgi:subtilisin family serine protease
MLRRNSPWILLAALALAACSDAAREVTAPEEARLDLAAAAGPQPTGRVAVVFKSETVPAAGLALVGSLGGTVTSRFDGAGVVFVSGLSAAALQALRASDLVEEAGPDYVLNWLPDVKVGGVAAVEADGGAQSHDPARASRFKTWQWGPQAIEADRAWAAGYRGIPGVRVAILDTGIDFLHRELRGLVDTNLSRSFIETEPTFDDLHFHGTHVASTVASNSVTTAGVAPHVTLIAVKVLSFEGSGTFEGVIGGIVHAADVDAHVINMSLGAEFDKKLEGAKALIRAMQRAVQYAQKSGTLVVSAAGNSAINLDESGTVVAMPCMVSTLCVSATGPLNGQFDADGPVLTENHDQPSSFTNYGFRAIHVAAPGGNYNPDDPDQAQGTWRDEDLVAGACAGRSTVVPQCAINNDVVAFYVFAAGTSMAAPHVSGAAALITSQHGGALTPDQLVERLTRYADDVGAPGRDIYSNFGRINVYRAITQQ